MRGGGDREMKLRLIYVVVLAALLAICAATLAQGTSGADANDGYSWFDGR